MGLCGIGWGRAIWGVVFLVGHNECVVGSDGGGKKLWLVLRVGGGGGVWLFYVEAKKAEQWGWLNEESINGRGVFRGTQGRRRTIARDGELYEGGREEARWMVSI